MASHKITKLTTDSQALCLGLLNQTSGKVIGRGKTANDLMQMWNHLPNKQNWELVTMPEYRDYLAERVLSFIEINYFTTLN